MAPIRVRAQEIRIVKKSIYACSPKYWEHKREKTKA
jgi:hypothetical protein